MNLQNHQYIYLYLSILIMCMLPIKAFAAPFCVHIQDGVNQQCVYYDVAMCQRDAGSMGGTCVASREYLASFMRTRLVGMGQFCLMGSQYFSSCIYQTQEECLAGVSRAGGAGICIDKAVINQEEEARKALLGDDDYLNPSFSPLEPFDPFELDNNNMGVLRD